MPKGREKKQPRKRRVTTAGGLNRVSTYLHDDELAAIEELARKERCSRSDAIRRAIRGFFQIED